MYTHKLKGFAKDEYTQERIEGYIPKSINYCIILYISYEHAPTVQIILKPKSYKAVASYLEIPIF
jgi:hypothetical protein